MTYKKEWMHSLFYEVAHCSVSISKTITQKEWKKIYREIRTLTKKLDFSYLREFNFEGVKGQCISRADEAYQEFLGAILDPEYPVLKIEGLYSQRLLFGHSYIDKKLRKNWCEQKEGDAFLGYAHSDESLSIIMLGDELQNTTYIINVLAIAFFIEARLQEKAFVYGPFPYEYAVEAVNKINKYLKEPIGLPTVCRANDLMTLTQKTHFSEKEKCEFFYKTYMGKYDEECWKILHENFTDEIINEFYTKHTAANSDDENIPDIQEDISDDEKEIESKQDENENQYDIELSTQLCNYKKGNSINPDLLKDIIKILEDLAPAKEQDGYKKLSEDCPLDQLRKIAYHLVRNDYTFALLDKDWKHIIHCFKTKKNALERYYPLFTVRCDPYEITSNIICALMVNDALYNYCVSQQKENKKQN